jgi:hypothetical protein
VSAKTGAPAYIKPGEPVELVRWTLTKDGWEAETVAGIYHGRDIDSWVITVAGELREYDRSTWDWCQS